MSDPTVATSAGRDENGAARAKQAGARWINRAAGKLDQARKPVAEKLHGTADAIRKQAQSLFEQESISEGISDAVHGAADRVESSAAYLDSHDVLDMTRDAADVVKRHPVNFYL